MVAGGTALIAASTVTGVSYLAPALGGLLFGKYCISVQDLMMIYIFTKYAGTGAALLGGNMAAQSMCLGNTTVQYL